MNFKQSFKDQPIIASFTTLIEKEFSLPFIFTGSIKKNQLRNTNLKKPTLSKQ